MQTAHTEHIDGAFGGNGLLLSGRTDAGREIGIYVSEKQITTIVDKLSTAGCIGHALWHVQNPDDKFPCSSCRKTA